MERRAIAELGFRVEDPVNFDTLNRCAICGGFTDYQICDRCKEALYKEDVS